MKFIPTRASPPCTVGLGEIGFLVGRNGAGKSNFLDALEFIHDACSINLEYAITSHGGPGSIRRVGTDNASFAFTFSSPAGEEIEYRLALALPKETNTYQVAYEELVSSVTTSPSSLKVDNDRALGLSVAASSDDNARLAYDFAQAMRFYDFSLPALRSPQTRNPGELLKSDGSNLASVLYRMQTKNPERYERLQEYLRSILPELVRVERTELGECEAITFHFVGVQFFAQHMSTGTLLSLASLVAMLQPADVNGRKPTLVAIEEPERALHPAAVRVLLDAMMEASNDRQILVTTQSADLLDRHDVPAERLLAVISGPEGTKIGPIDDSARIALSQQLFTAGELVRQDQLSSASHMGPP